MSEYPQLSQKNSHLSLKADSYWQIVGWNKPLPANDNWFAGAPSTVVVHAMSEVQFQPSRSVALQPLGFGIAAFAVLAVFASLFWMNRTYSEAQVEGTPVSNERGSTEIAPAGNEIAWGFSDRWFPLIQAVSPSATATGLQLTDVAPVAELSRPQGKSAVPSVRHLTFRFNNGHRYLCLVVGQY